MPEPLYTPHNCPAAGSAESPPPSKLGGGGRARGRASRLVQNHASTDARSAGATILSRPTPRLSDAGRLQIGKCQVQIANWSQQNSMAVASGPKPDGCHSRKFVLTIAEN